MVERNLLDKWCWLDVGGMVSIRVCLGLLGIGGMCLLDEVCPILLGRKLVVAFVVHLCAYSGSGGGGSRLSMMAGRPLPCSVHV